MIQRFKAGGAVWALVLQLAAPLGAQQTETRERLLSQGWSELAAGRIAAAAATAARMLKTSPRDHDAASLAVAADLAGPGPMRALDSYERWLTASRREDPFLLEAVGAGVLRTLSSADEPRIGFAALAALVRFGDAAARKQLASIEQDPNLSIEGEAALAEAGSPVGFERLRTRISAGGRQDKSRAIDALKRSQPPGAASAIAEALKDPGPPSRIAAAIALVELNATDAIPQLRAAAADPEPAVRGAVQVALGLLGDPEERAAMDSLASSPLADYRLLAARQTAARDPDGAWVASVGAMLNDPDPVVRLEAAELLLSHGHTAAAEGVLTAALGDASGPLRSVAARVLIRLPPGDRGTATIRRMLRDPLTEVRLEAARALLFRR